MIHLVPTKVGPTAQVPAHLVEVPRDLFDRSLEPFDESGEIVLFRDEVIQTETSEGFLVTVLVFPEPAAVLDATLDAFPVARSVTFDEF